ncbi:MAG: FAD-binding oxidoreductase [Chloroflexi bacterium]|nr:FAD-binding oxidoreductase [Chloroflexota bacterium]
MATSPLTVEHSTAALTQDPAVRSLFRLEDREPQFVAHPASTADVVQIMRLAQAQNWSVVPWGAGRQQSIGNLPDQYDLALSLEKLRGVVEYDVENYTITVQAGMTWAELNTLLRANHQYIPLDPADARSTLGGLVVTDVNGARRLGYGTWRDWVLGARLVLADGTVIRAGGKVVKNVAGYDLPKLIVGSLGTLAVVTEVTLRLTPISEAGRTLVITGPEILAPYVKLAEQILALNLEPVAVDLISGLEHQYGLLVRVEGMQEAVDRQAAAFRSRCDALSSFTVKEVEGADQQLVWEAAGPGRSDDPADMVQADAISGAEIRCRVSVPIVALPAVLAECQALVEALGLGRRFQAQMGSGAAHIWLTQRYAAEPDSIADALLSGLDRLRLFCTTPATLQGHLIVEQVPPRLRSRVDLWGPRDASLNVMAKIKRVFDPAGRLNPGRYGLVN